MANPPISLDAKFYAKVESSYAATTNGVIAAGDGVPLLDLQMEPAIEYIRSMEHLGTAGRVDEVMQKFSGRFNLEAYLKPNSAGTAPDIGEILRAAIGTETVGGSSVVYELNSSDPNSIQLARYVPDKLYETAVGCLIEEMTIEISGNQVSTIKAQGGFGDFGFVYSGDLQTDSDLTQSSSTTLTLDNSAHAQLVRKHGQIAINGDTTPYRVTAYDPSTRVVTFSPAFAASNITTNDLTVKPYAAAPTLAGAILSGGVNSSYSLDGGSTYIGMISTRITLRTGYVLLDQEATSIHPNGVARGPREVEIESQLYFRPDVAGPWSGGAYQGLVTGLTAQDANVRINVGDTGGRHVRILCPKVRFEPASPVMAAGGDVATVTLRGFARKSSTDNDELSIGFY